MARSEGAPTRRVGRYPASTLEEATSLLRWGAGAKKLSSALSVPLSTARGWVRRYSATGSLSTPHRSRYSPRVRLAAACDHVERHLTLTAVMRKYRIGSDRTLKAWCRAYRERRRLSLTRGKRFRHSPWD